jgi:hypothetical protein
MEITASIFRVNKTSCQLSTVLCLLFSVLSFSPSAKAQYAPQAGVMGSTAIPVTSQLIKSWANECVVQRGYLDIAQPSLGYVSSGSDNMGIGPADNSVVSLGDSGIAMLKFSYLIVNGPGPDFAVFENGFADPSDPEQAFLELAFVEVSSDGINYFRFPASSYTQVDTQIAVAGMYMDAKKINNLAGKYVGNFGTPFDLQELAGVAGLNINAITHVRVVDVIGSIGAHASLDTGSRKINDPYSTAIPTGGFDLDAVAVLNQGTNTDIRDEERSAMLAYPNPAIDHVIVRAGKPVTITLSDMTGKLLWNGRIEKEGSISTRDYSPGTYLLTITDTQGRKCVERISKL